MKKLRFKKPRLDARRVVGVIVLATLVFSIGFVIVSMIGAPEEAPAGEEYVKVKSDYGLMLLQCVLGLLVFFLPDMLRHRLSLRLPNYLYVLYYIFLYCAIYLGEVRDFFYLIPHWDTVLHAFSGVMLGCVGFALITILNSAENVRLHLSPGFIALFAFCFALAAGTVWEIYEFSGDHLLGLNMQKYRLENGALLSGHEALRDTMEDLIIDAVSAGAVSLFGYLAMKGKPIAGFFIRLFSKQKNTDENK